MGQTSVVTLRKGDSMKRILQKIKALKNDVYILYLAFKHPQTPALVKIVVGLIVAYTFSPIDLVPDFIPVLGYIDELILVPIFVSVAYRLVPAVILEDCRRFARENPLTKKLRLWAGAVLILIIWLLAALYIIQWHWK